MVVKDVTQRVVAPDNNEGMVRCERHLDRLPRVTNLHIVSKVIASIIVLFIGELDSLSSETLRFCDHQLQSPLLRHVCIKGSHRIEGMWD